MCANVLTDDLPPWPASYAATSADFCSRAAYRLLSASPLQAQSPTLPSQLTFEEAKALMLQHNPALRAGRAAVNQHAFEAQTPTLWPNPSVNVSQDRTPIPTGGIDNQLVLQPRADAAVSRHDARPGARGQPPDGRRDVRATKKKPPAPSGTCASATSM